jgi:hypothetical protein
MTGRERLGIGGLSQGYLSGRPVIQRDPNEVAIGI